MPASGSRRDTGVRTHHGPGRQGANRAGSSRSKCGRRQVAGFCLQHDIGLIGLHATTRKPRHGGSATIRGCKSVPEERGWSRLVRDRQLPKFGLPLSREALYGLFLAGNRRIFEAAGQSCQQVPVVGDRLWPSDKIPLNLVAPFRHQEGELFFGLDTFGNDGQRQGAA